MGITLNSIKKNNFDLYLCNLNISNIINPNKKTKNLLLITYIIGGMKYKL